MVWIPSPSAEGIMGCPTDEEILPVSTARTPAPHGLSACLLLQRRITPPTACRSARKWRSQAGGLGQTAWRPLESTTCGPRRGSTCRACIGYRILCTELPLLATGRARRQARQRLHVFRFAARRPGVDDSRHTDRAPPPRDDGGGPPLHLQGNLRCQRQSVAPRTEIDARLWWPTAKRQRSRRRPFPRPLRDRDRESAGPGTPQSRRWRWARDQALGHVMPRRIGFDRRHIDEPWPVPRSHGRRAA
jgi:hypothetical protein